MLVYLVCTVSSLHQEELRYEQPILGFSGDDKQRIYNQSILIRFKVTTIYSFLRKNEYSRVKN